MALLEVDSVTVRFRGITALDELSFSVEAGQICGLIGPNGAGKTTFFNVVSRIYQPASGAVTFDGRDLLGIRPSRIPHLGIYRTFQNLALWPALSVIENVMVGGHVKGKVGIGRALLGVPAVTEDRKAATRAYEILDELGLANIAFRRAAGLPYGTLKRIELARALAGEPRFLMLDEPASGLTHSEVEELAGVIRGLRDRHHLTVLLVEHHMGMVMSLSDHVVVLDFGRKIAQGTATEVAQNPRVVEAYLGTAA